MIKAIFDWEGFQIEKGFMQRVRLRAIGCNRAALENGGRDNGGAGPRPEHGPDYFAAFVFDPDGHRIEAVLDEQV